MISIQGLTQIDDTEYRYKMPYVSTKIQGSGNGIKTQITNISDIASALRRPFQEILQFIVYDLGTQFKDTIVINGAYTSKVIQGCIFKYIETFVLCQSCKKPEVPSYRINDKKIYMYCEGCGETHQISPEHKLCKYIIRNKDTSAKISQSSSIELTDELQKTEPIIGALTICKPTKIDPDVGVFVDLVEFPKQDYKGFVSIGEISKRRKKKFNPTRLLKIGKEFVAAITSIDDHNIDLTKCRVLPDEEQAYMQHYKKVKKINNICHEIEKFLQLKCKQIIIDKLLLGWSIELEENKICYILNKLEQISIDLDLLTELDYPDNIKNALINIIPKYFRIPSIVVTHDLQIVCNGSVQTITDALQQINQLVPPIRFKQLKIRVDGPPNYSISVSCNPFHKKEAKEYLISLETQIQTHISNNTIYPSIKITESSVYPRDLEQQPTINVGLVGSFSHGKSTVCKYLTGKKTEVFKAELARNCTIKLGYSNCKIFKCSKCNSLQSRGSKISTVSCCDTPMLLIKHISFIDCPGHEALMSTMLSGAAVMDAALLLIAADSSAKQKQTIEHVGVIDTILDSPDKVGILQNKCELVKTDAGIDHHHSEIQEVTRDTVLSKSPIIPISANLGFNMDKVVEHLASLPEPTFEETPVPARLMVIRSFDINVPSNISKSFVLKGGVLGGSLVSGVLEKNQLIEIRPGEVSLREIITLEDGRQKSVWKCTPYITLIESIRSESTELDYVIPGGLVAVQTQMDPRLVRSDKLVGSIAGSIGTLPPIYDTIKIKFNQIKSKDYKKHKLKKNDKIRLNIGGLNVLGLILRVSKSKQMILVELNKPVCISINDRVAISCNVVDKWKLLYWGNVMDGDSVEIEYSGDYGEQPISSISASESVDRHTERPSLVYNELYDKFRVDLNNSEINALLKSNEKQKIPPPLVALNGPRKTMWMNFAQTAIAIKRSQQHLMAYISFELGVNTSITAEQYLTIHGRFQSMHIQRVLIKYCNIYLVCKQCHKTDTTLEYDPASKLVFLTCGICKSRNSVPIIHSKFHSCKK